MATSTNTNTTSPAAGALAVAARHLTTRRALLALTALVVAAVVAVSVAVPRRAEKVSWVPPAAETTAAGVGGRPLFANLADLKEAWQKPLRW
jgi:hypothetical protein